VEQVRSRGLLWVCAQQQNQIRRVGLLSLLYRSALLRGPLWRKLFACLSRPEVQPMSHPIYRIVSFETVGAYRLRIAFDDGTEQTVNFLPVLAGELYARLRDLALFNAVKIDPEVHTLVWPNGADFDPATLHDWPEYVDALADRAKRWSLTPA
jgi:Protein of unknown function (DUF2442)